MLQGLENGDPMTPTPVDRDVQTIEGWYINHVRPFLERIEKIDSKPGRLGDFDAELERLKKASSAYNDEMVVCFLGLSGVGKSTLINALVDGRRGTLPHGGVGPLTAQALSVRRGKPPGFQVSYHTPGQIWKLVNALEWGYREELKEEPLSGPEGSSESHEDEGSLTPEERQELDDLTQSREVEDRSRVESYRKQAQLLVKGDQDTREKISYLVDSLRGRRKASQEQSTARHEDAERIRKLKARWKLVIINGTDPCPMAISGRISRTTRPGSWRAR